MSDVKGIISILKDDAGELHFPMTSAEAVLCDDKTLETVINDLKESILNVPLKEGPKGDKGIQGFVGPQGPKGDKGIRGLQGDKGDTGIQGVKGVTGPKGDTGPQGAKGDTGAKGDKGLKGVTGDKGDKGDSGVYIGKPAEAPLSANLIVDDDPKEYDQLIADARRDYMGTAHETLRDSANSNVEYSVKSVVGELNYLPYEGQTIYAKNTIEGHAKDAILKGQTLVNLLVKPFDSCVIGTTSNTGHMKTTYPTTSNKKYVITFLVSELNIDGNTDGVKIIIRGNTLNNGYNSTNLDSSKIKSDGVVKLILNDTKEFSTILIGVSASTNVNAPSFKISNIMLIPYQDGMENWDIPYFTGMTSSKMPVLSSFGKNLFDGELELGAINEADGKISINENCVRSKNYQRVIPNTSYALSNDKGYQGNVYYYTKDKTYISPIGLVNYKFTTPKNCYYVKFRSSAGLVQNDLSVKFQLEQGTSATTYEPYKSNILSLSEEVVLRSLPSGVKDTYNLVTKEYVRRIGEKILNGSTDEDWINNPIWGNGDYYTAYVKNQFLDKAPGRYNIIANNSPNTLKLNPSLNLITGEGIFGETATIYVYVCVAKSKLATIDKVGFTKHLQSNPITVQYELATPVIKAIELSSYGNWEKVVLDGSDDETYNIFPSQANTSIGTQLYQTVASDSETISNNTINIFSSKSGLVPCTANDLWHDRIGGEGISFGSANSNGIIQIRIKIQTVAELKQYLTKHPITVWYQTLTSQINSINEVYSYDGSTTYICSSEVEGVDPTLSIKVPTDVQAVIQTEREYNQELLMAQNVVIETQLSLYEAQPVLLTSESEEEMPVFVRNLYELAYERGLRLREEEVTDGDLY